MPKFFAPEAAPGARFLVLTGENAAHARVLRLKAGESVTVCDAKGTDFQCVISDIAPEQVSLVVQSEAPSRAEPGVFCSVYMAFAKAEKLEHVVQKATELGAGEIVAFPSSRCVARLDEKTLAKKLERWQKIAASAAEQSGRGRSHHRQQSVKPDEEPYARSARRFWKRRSANWRCFPMKTKRRSRFARV